MSTYLEYIFFMFLQIVRKGWPKTKENARNQNREKPLARVSNEKKRKPELIAIVAYWASLIFLMARPSPFPRLLYVSSSAGCWPGPGGGESFSVYPPPRSHFLMWFWYGPGDGSLLLNLPYCWLPQVTPSMATPSPLFSSFGVLVCTWTVFWPTTSRLRVMKMSSRPPLRWWWWVPTTMTKRW